jgi:hypothetical protein
MLRLLSSLPIFIFVRSATDILSCCSSACVFERSTPKTCSPSYMPASAARLERPCSASLESLLSLLKSGFPSLESSSSPLLEGSTFSDTGAPTSMKQYCLLQFQKRLAPVRGRFLNFVEQRTRLVPSLRLGRAAKMYSHERPSFHIWSSFISSSSVHGALPFFGFNGA